jgi:hypothetical protein
MVKNRAEFFIPLAASAFTPAASFFAGLLDSGHPPSDYPGSPVVTFLLTPAIDPAIGPSCA